MPLKSTVSSSFSVKEVFLGHEEGTLHSAAFDVISWVCQIMSWHHVNHLLLFYRFYQMALSSGQNRVFKGVRQLSLRHDLGTLPGGAASPFVGDGGDIKWLTLITFIATAL